MMLFQIFVGPCWKRGEPGDRSGIFGFVGPASAAQSGRSSIFQLSLTRWNWKWIMPYVLLIICFACDCLTIGMEKENPLHNPCQRGASNLHFGGILARWRTWRWIQDCSFRLLEYDQLTRHANGLPLVPRPEAHAVSLWSSLPPSA